MKQAKQALFFYQSPLTVFVASILSANTYSFYWFYKQWKVVGLQEGTKSHPIVAAIFSEFTSFVLFRKVWHKAPVKDVRYRQLYLVPAISLLFIATIGLVISILFIQQPLFELLISFVAIVINSGFYAWVQKVINTTAPKNTPSLHKLQLSSPEIVFLVIGFVIFFGNIPALLFLPSADTIMRRNEDFQKTTHVLSVRYKALDNKFANCNNALTARYRVLDTTSQSAVDSYNKDVDACQNVMKQRDEVGNQMTTIFTKQVQSIFQK